MVYSRPNTCMQYGHGNPPPPPPNLQTPQACLTQNLSPVVCFGFLFPKAASVGNHEPPPGGGGGHWGPGQPTQPHQKTFPQEKKTLSKGPEFSPFMDCGHRLCWGL